MVLRIAAFIAREHGLAALQAVASHHQVVAIFTHSLNPTSEDPLRSVRPEYPMIEAFAVQKNIPIFKIDEKKDVPTIYPILKTLQFDVILSVSWRYKIPAEDLALAQYGGINIHRGRLPDYAGAFPIKQALERGDQQIFITAHQMSEEIDAGEVLAIAQHPFVMKEDESQDECVARLKKEITPYFGPLALQSLRIGRIRGRDK